MIRFAKLLPMFGLALLLLLLPASAAVSKAAGAKSMSMSVSKNFSLIKPGETVMVDLNVQKLAATDKVELKIKTSPLQIRTVEDAVDQDPMIHHAQLFVTAPMGMDFKAYRLAVTVASGQAKASKAKLTFQLVSDEGGTPEFNISSASYSVDFQMYLGGIGLGDAPKVIVNGKDISAMIKSATSDMIFLSGGAMSDLNIKVGENEINVIVNGKAANTFILRIGDPNDHS